MVVALVALTTMAVAGVGPLPVAAAPQILDLAMPEGEGSLTIRDAEPRELGTPTTYSGLIDDQTGVITSGALSTPEVSFEQEVTSPLSATAYIDATFTQVTPGSGSGTVDEFGAVVINDQLTVDLHIEVVPTGATTPLDLPGDCTSSPVSLSLISESPYNPDSKRITLSDPDFTVPPVQADQRCSALIADNINNQLGGSGHALSITFEGDVLLPPPAGCETTTALEVDPADGTSLGDAVTMTAAIAPVEADPECVEAAADGEPLVGSVDFLDGTTTVGTVAVDDMARAQLTTSALSAGSRRLSARYRGSPPYQASTSSSIDLPVAARPAITSSLPPFIEVGAPPVEFDVTVSNSGFGNALEGSRLDLTVRRAGAGIGALTPPMVNMEVLVGDDWVPVAFTGPASRTLLGSLGSTGDFDVQAGGEVTRRTRVSFGHDGAPMPPAGSITATFELVDGGNPPALAPTMEPLATGLLGSTLVNADRTATTITFAPAGSGGPISPHTVRAGNSITLPGVNITPVISNVRATGFVEVLIDGQVVPSARPPFLLNPGEQLRHELTGGAAGSYVIPTPADVAPGTHTLTFRYSGDAIFEGSSASATFTVVPPVGGLYECTSEGSPQHRYRAQIVAQANLPASAPAGSIVDLDHLAVRVLTDRSFVTTNSFSGLLNNDAVNTVGSPVSFEGVRLDIGPEGDGRATGIDRRFGVLMPSEPNPATTEIDHSLTLLNESGEVLIDGELGESVPVTLDALTIDLRATGLGIPYNERCVPVGDPITLGAVTVAGVGLEVTPGSTVRAGQAVRLAAVTAPSTATGLVEFRDGSSTIGVVPVVGGAASMSTADLAPGEHTFTARFYPQPMAPVMVSESANLTVLPEFDCGGFAQAGNGAAVRLVYMELLGRCPDQAGFAYWTGRLDDGEVTREQFARTISASLEARGVIVNDAYLVMLGRNAEPAARTFWAGRLGANARYDALLTDLAASGEFRTLAGGTDEGVVKRIYERMLGRSPEPSGLAYWVDFLQQRGIRRLVPALFNLQESLAVVVTDAYRDVLGRNPSSSERELNARLLALTSNRSALYGRLIATNEFFLRSQGFPNLD